MSAAIQVDIRCSSPVFAESVARNLKSAGLSVLNHLPRAAPVAAGSSAVARRRKENQ